MTAETHSARIRAEVREIQKAAAVLGCIQCTAEYDNIVEVDLADAVSVVRDIIGAVATRMDALGIADKREGGSDRPG